MKQFKIMLLMIDILMSNMAQQWYEIRTKPPFFVANCTERYVVSLLMCAAIGREAKDVTFFFNGDNNHCRWNCTFVYITGVTNGNVEWWKYGKKLIALQ